jgi:L-threonylcarbamoyladenylate synthase
MQDLERPDTAQRTVQPDQHGLQRAADLLRRGAVCAFPTETVYGLGANVFSKRAIAEVYRLKQRPTWNPLIVHAATVEDARSMAQVWPEEADALSGRYWPGPLTMVVERARHLPGYDRPGSNLIAIRVPAHPVASALLRTCGVPLAAPSANRSQGISPTTAEHVRRSLPDVPLILDGGPCRLGIESTVLDLTTPSPTLLRPGALALRAITDVVGAVRLPEPTVVGRAVRSPGMSRRHYAPRATVLLRGRDALTADQSAAATGLLTYEPMDHLSNFFDHVELLSADPREYAADLYAALHRLDDAEVARIVVLTPPGNEEWLAIRDRLSRAAAPVEPEA